MTVSQILVLFYLAGIPPASFLIGRFWGESAAFCALFWPLSLLGWCILAPLDWLGKKGSDWGYRQRAKRYRRDREREDRKNESET